MIIVLLTCLPHVSFLRFQFSLLYDRLTVTGISCCIESCVCCANSVHEMQVQHAVEVVSHHPVMAEQMGGDAEAARSDKQCQAGSGDGSCSGDCGIPPNNRWDYNDVLSSTARIPRLQWVERFLNAL